MDTWLSGLQRRAEQVLPEPVARYYRHGAADGISAAEAVAAWRRYRLVPRVLRDVSDVSTGTSVLGTEVETPVLVAPSTLQRHAHPEGEVELARGVRRAGSLVCVSSNAGSSFEAIAAGGAPWWLQVYVMRDRSSSRATIAAAVDAGARAIVLTVDTPVVARKDVGKPSVWDITPDDYLHANTRLTGARHTELDRAADLAPADIGWLAETSGLPVVVKGVLHPEDAVLAVRAGARAVWVSNHGGRQLDRAVATADALPAVAGAVRAAGSEAEVYVDGGLRDGRDVLVALACGAAAVFVGRPPLWALAEGGAAGVERCLRDLTADLQEAMVLSGATGVGAVDAPVRAGQTLTAGPCR